MAVGTFWGGQGPVIPWEWLFHEPRALSCLSLCGDSSLGYEILCVPGHWLLLQAPGSASSRGWNAQGRDCHLCPCRGDAQGAVSHPPSAQVCEGGRARVGVGRSAGQKCQAGSQSPPEQVAQAQRAPGCLCCRHPSIQLSPGSICCRWDEAAPTDPTACETLEWSQYQRVGCRTGAAVGPAALQQGRLMA